MKFYQLIEYKTVEKNTLETLVPDLFLINQNLVYLYQQFEVDMVCFYCMSKSLTTTAY